MYIVIEGLKGAGKSTLLDALNLRLKQENVRFSLVMPTRPLPRFCLVEWLAKHCRFLIRYDFFCRYLYRYRSNQHARQADWHQPLILGDRSILTSLATRWPTDNQAHYIQKTKLQEYEIPWPDEVIYLQVPFEALLLRLKGRKRNYGENDESIKRLHVAFDAYQDLQHKGEYLGMPLELECQPPDEVLEKVYALLKSRCPSAWHSEPPYGGFLCQQI